jgi:hypothetical protein
MSFEGLSFDDYLSIFRIDGKVVEPEILGEEERGARTPTELVNKSTSC